MGVLQPHYGIGMHQTAALLLVPDIPLTDKKTVKKSLQLTLHLTKYLTIYNLDFTFTFYHNVMSGIN